jgi:hypothetical protein
LDDVRGRRSWKRLNKIDLVGGQDGGRVRGEVGKIEAEARCGGRSRSRRTKVLGGDELIEGGGSG